MLKRLQRMWRLSRKDPDKLEFLLQAPEAVVETVRDEDDREVVGAFFPEATQQDFEEQEAEDSGMKAWLDRIRGL